PPERASPTGDLAVGGGSRGRLPGRQAPSGRNVSHLRRLRDPRLGMASSEGRARSEARPAVVSHRDGNLGERPRAPRHRGSDMTGNQFRPPVTLRGRYLELVPLERAHAAGLADAGRDPEVWRFLRIGPGHPPSVAEMETFIDQLLEFQAVGELLAFTMVLLPERPLVGIIRFLDIDRANQRVELGTWLDSRYWGSPLNAQQAPHAGLRFRRGGGPPSPAEDGLAKSPFAKGDRASRSRAGGQPARGSPRP